MQANLPIPWLLLAALLLYPITGIAGLLAKRKSNWGRWLFPAGAIGAAVLGMVPVCRVLATGVPIDLQLPWTLPVGSFHLGLDPLSAWFAIPVLLVSALSALYGTGYMRSSEGRSGIGLHRLCFQLLAGGMLLVLLARDGFLFLMAWEIMSMAAFFLVVFDHEEDSVRKAGWIYLAATHLGTAFLFALFILMAVTTGSTDLSPAQFAAAPFAGIAFILAIIGFGSKAGFFGLHVWLPEAHPAAPSHVSGLMSGVMIKTGIYGILRILMLYTDWQAWWGWLLLGIGIVSGLGGVLFALLQHDLKRILAYHSVENIGIIALGMGVGVLGSTEQLPLVALLGFSGALLHVLNHALFKTALFMGAGSVVHACGTRQIEQMGGLAKKMPFTAALSTVAAIAICGLPPLNGFASEFLIYSAAGQGLLHGETLTPLLFAVLSIVALAAIGGLACFCFAKVIGIVFLGEPRSTQAAQAHEVEPIMISPLFLIVAACIGLGLFSFLLVPILGNIAATLTPGRISEPSFTLIPYLVPIGVVGIGLWLLLGATVLLRRRFLRGKIKSSAPTWDCGYSQPSARMQYTGSSFVQPLQSTFEPLLKTTIEGQPPQGIFPEPTELETETPDPVMARGYEPLFRRAADLFGRFRAIQNGRVQLYVAYIAVVLLAVLLWSVR